MFAGKQINGITGRPRFPLEAENHQPPGIPFCLYNFYEEHKHYAEVGNFLC